MRMGPRIITVELLMMQESARITVAEIQFSPVTDIAKIFRN